MRGVLVAIDLETTGLDPADSHIIEIGAVKFREHDILETYSTLVDPGVSIPPKITDITGIKMEDLIGAPKIAEVLPKLVAFAGNAPIVGHNVDFDLRFLHKQGVLTANDAIDTYELAAVLMPTAERYNLNALMQVLNIAPEGAYHRALTDAIADARLYQALWAKLLRDVPYDVLREIAGLSRDLAWRGKAPFEAALKVREGERPAKVDPVMASFTPAPELIPQDQISRQPAAFEPAGQILVETADLSALWSGLAKSAVQQNQQIVIAVTDGVDRQHLIKDLTALQESMPLRVTALRRRRDYICPAQLSIARKQPPADVETLRLLAKTLVWLAEGGITPGAEPLSVRGPAEQIVWTRLSAEICTHERCAGHMHGLCPLFKDRVAAQQSHVVIVDQALLIPDARSHDPILPPYQHILITHASALEESITDAMHTRRDAPGLKRQAAALGKRGIFSELLAAAKPTLPEKNYESLVGLTSGISEAATQMSYHVDNLFRALQSFLDTVNDKRSSDFSVQIRLTNDLRHKAAFSQVRASWSILSQFTETLTGALDQLARRVVKYNLPDVEHLRFVIESLSREMLATHRWLNECLDGSGENALYWAEISTDLDRIDRLSLHAAPLHVGPLLQKHLWDKTKTAILADITLRTSGSFDFVRGRLGTRDFKHQAPKYPEDVERPVLVYLPTDMPEPAEKDRYPKQVERGIIELASTIPGRVLALFGGFTALRQSAQHIGARLALGSLHAFDQSDGTSQTVLLENFRKVERGVLLGIRGFWETTDFDGIDLAALVVVRLPFAVPSDPTFAARSETYEDAFNQFTVPQAILNFRQSVERLMMRGKRGVVVVLDRRMTSKEYGGAFLDSLPPCTVRRAPIAELATTARDWLAG